MGSPFVKARSGPESPGINKHFPCSEICPGGSLACKWVHCKSCGLQKLVSSNAPIPKECVSLCAKKLLGRAEEPAVVIDAAVLQVNIDRCKVAKVGNQVPCILSLKAIYPLRNWSPVQNLLAGGGGRLK